MRFGKRVMVGDTDNGLAIKLDRKIWKSCLRRTEKG